MRQSKTFHVKKFCKTFDYDGVFTFFFDFETKEFGYTSYGTNRKKSAQVKAIAEQVYNLIVQGNVEVEPSNMEYIEGEIVG